MKANYEKVVKYIRDAAANKADLVVLPEFSLGPPTGPRDTFADKDGEYLEGFKNLAKELQINLVPGTLGEYIDGKLYNVAYWIDRSGTILGRYVKKNLWHPEREHFTKGDDVHQAFDTEFGKVGLLICWDIIFPEAFKQLVHQGVKLFVVPSYWLGSDGGEGVDKYNKDSEALLLKTVLPARAFENTAAIVYVNAAGKKEDGFIGLSQVALPFVGSKVILDESEQVQYVDFQLEPILEDAEHVYKIRADMKHHDWHY